MDSNKYHAIPAFAHAVMTMVVSVIIAVNGDPLYRVGYGRTTNAGPTWTDIGPISVRWLSLTFFMGSCLSHLRQLYWTPAEYEKVIRERVNPVQWVEYSITVGLMMTIQLAVICGETSVFAFMNRAGCTIATMFCGYLTEKHKSWLYYFAGWLFALPPFLQDIVLIATAGPLPWFVIVATVTTYLFFFSFAFVAAWELVESISSTGRSYTKTTSAYSALSIFAKINLGLFLTLAAR